MNDLIKQLCELIDTPSAKSAGWVYVREIEAILKAHEASDSAVSNDDLVAAAEFASGVLAELYAKYQTKIGPFASQAQLANVKLRNAIEADRKRRPVASQIEQTTPVVSQNQAETRDKPANSVGGELLDKLRNVLAYVGNRNDGDLEQLIDRAAHWMRGSKDCISMQCQLIQDRTAAPPSAAAAVPDGWQLVPVEPSLQQLQEGLANSYCPPMSAERLQIVYKAMLTAAPIQETKS